ncbi:MAG: alpha/beta hydrolase [Haloarculaceae archaeon]
MERATIGEGGIDYYYQDVGSGPPVAFVHGFSANHLSWYQQVPTFRDEYRCVVPDQRRFGLSVDTAGVGVGAFPDDLLDLLDHLGVAETALVGHSMGGWTVGSLATQQPERVSALVLSATPGGLIPPERHEELMAQGKSPEVDPLTPEQAFLAESIDGLNRDKPPSWEETRPPLDELPLDAGTVVEADIPTLVVAGEADEFMPAPAIEAVGDRLDAETAVIENAGHSAYFEQPEAFNSVVTGFLDDHLG